MKLCSQNRKEKITSGYSPQRQNSKSYKSDTVTKAKTYFEANRLPKYCKVFYAQRFHLYF